MNLKNILTSGRMFAATLTILLTIFCSQSAYAETDDAKARSLIDGIVSAPVNIDGEDREYAHVWFKEIFGEFIFGPWDSKYKSGTVTLVSKAVGFTNILAMILGIVIVYYVLIGGALNTAHHGEALGKEWSSMWIPIRTATGFFLITPIGTVGGGVLSFAQVFIIWTIMLGSNAATVLWNTTIDEVMDGTPTNSPDIHAGTSITTQTFKMLMCTEFYIRNKPKLSVISNQDYKIIAEMELRDGGTKAIFAKFRDEIDAYSMEGIDVGSQIQSSDPVRIEFANNGACGSIDFGTDVEKKEGGGDRQDYKIDAMNVAYKKAAQLFGKMISDLQPIVESLTAKDSGPMAINAVSKEPNPADGRLVVLLDSNAKQLSAIAMQLSDSFIPAIHSELSGSDAVMNKFKNEIKKGGWGKAGIWFFEIGSLPQLTYKVFNSITDSVNYAEPTFCSSVQHDYEYNYCATVQAEFGEYAILEKNIIGLAVSNIKTSNPEAISEADKFSSSCNESSCSVDPNMLHNTSTKVAKSILNTLATGSWWLSSKKSGDPIGNTSGMSSPFETVTGVGSTLNRYTAELWGLGLLMNASIESIGAMQNGVSNSVVGFFGGGVATGGISGFILGALKWVVMTLMTLMSLMAGVGFTLAYIIPFLPIITWVMMLTGYLITVVEAVIAAPLAIILMVTPEGEGIAGTRLERAMQLLAMAILKPSLMIIGLITAITMSSVAFSILNEFFFIAAEHVLKGSVFDFAAIMIIYMSAALNLCKMLIGIMHRLPDQILEWFSNGTGRSFGENESANAIESSMGDAKGGLGRGVGSMGGTMGHGIKANADKYRAKKAASETPPPTTPAATS
jgi:conjugal transfer/type IV secretion protein DotA/TraY